EPGRKLVLRIVSIECEIDLHEDFLSQIVSFFVAMGDAKHVVDQALFIAPDQLRESIAIAPENPRNQRTVIELLTFGHWCLTVPTGSGFRQRIIVEHRL